MKLKNFLITVVCVICVLVGLWLLLNGIFKLDLHLNIIKYYKVTDGDYTFSFKGSISQVRKITVKKDSKKVASLPFEASSNIFDTEGGYNPLKADLNFDGNDDILFIFASDADGDIHYSAFIYDPSGNTYSCYDGMNDLCNIEVYPENAIVTSEQTVRNELNSPNGGNPALYDEKHSLTKYRWIDGKFTAYLEKAITYYSETGIYSYSVYQYDAEYDSLKYVTEEWFEESEYTNYNLK